MKKIFLLFVAATLAACSAEPVENEGIDSLDAAVAGREKTVIQQVIETLDYPETLCVGEVGEFTFIFEGKRNGATNLKLDIYMDNPETDEVDVDWYNIFKGKSTVAGSQEVETYYTFDAKETYNMRYQIGGSPVEFSLNVVICEPVCAKGKGFWTNHGPLNPGNQENSYPEGGVKIGDYYYELEKLQEILQVNGNTGHIFKMKQHLITAILNIYNGVDGSTIVNTIEEANSIIATNGDNYSPEEIKAVKDVLENFSKSHACEDYED